MKLHQLSGLLRMQQNHGEGSVFNATIGVIDAANRSYFCGLQCSKKSGCAGSIVDRC